jgi:hypothetical protein
MRCPASDKQSFRKDDCMKNPELEIDRVRRNTSPEILEQIDRVLEERIRFYSTQPQHVIARRIEELEREWDIERLLQTNASALILTGAIMGLTAGKKWFLLSCGVAGFLLQHAIQGWCPPIPLLRKLGVRTRGEIDQEKFALKALRGDFNDLPQRKEASDFPSHELVQSVTA